MATKQNRQKHENKSQIQQTKAQQTHAQQERHKYKNKRGKTGKTGKAQILHKRQQSKTGNT